MRKIICMFLSVFCLFGVIPKSILAESEITVYVEVYDYTSSLEKNAILEKVGVSVDSGSNALSAIEKVLSENDIEFLINDQYEYISEIDGLSEFNDGSESGWMFCVNNDFNNLGAKSVSVKENDVYGLHYSVEGYGTDVGNYFSGTPAIKSLSDGQNQVTISSKTIYLEDYSQITTYYLGDYIDGGDNILILGNGTYENPFIIPFDIQYSQKINLEYDTTLNSNYVSFETGDEFVDLREEFDYSDEIRFCLETIGGFKKTYYKIVSTKNDNSLPNYTGDWTSNRGNSENMGITNAITPKTTEECSLKWAAKLSEGYSDAFCPPIIVNDNLYVAKDNRVLIIDKLSGSVTLQSEELMGSIRYGLNTLSYGDGMIFVPINDGRIQALRADNLESLWVSEGVGGQSISPILYSDGYVYSGTWNGERNIGTYYCVKCEDTDTSNGTEEKMCVWKIEHTGGFYWAGALSSDDYIIFGSDDGAGGSESESATLYCVNKQSGEVVDKIEQIKGDIRSSICFDKSTNSICFTTKGGRFYKVKVNDDGTINKNEVSFFELGGTSTSTPTIYDGIAYVGVSSGSSNSICAINMADMSEVKKYSMPGYVQSSVLISVVDNSPYIYSTYNNIPGGLYLIDVNSNISKEIFTPQNDMAQYCICSPICDSNGTIYYKNDSGYLFALGVNEEENVNINDLVQKEENTEEKLDIVKDEPIIKNKFSDINNHWAKAYIENLWEKGIISGKTENEFFPDDSVTRAEFITILYRISKAVNLNKNTKFNDVLSDSWYFDAVSWAVENNITNGINENEFKPHDCITREQMATFISRFADLMKYSLNPKQEEIIFSDKTDFSAFASADIRRIQMAGIICGFEDNTFLPKNIATRAETAKIISELIK